MKILILEDNRDRIAAFQSVVAELPGCELVVWRNAPGMIKELSLHLPSASLISLDHDLVQDAGDPDPGDGLQVAEAIATYAPTCPIILHSTNVNRVYSMIRELADGGWIPLRVAPVGMGENWILSTWLPKVKSLLATATVQTPDAHSGPVS